MMPSGDVWVSDYGVFGLPVEVMSTVKKWASEETENMAPGAPRKLLRDQPAPLPDNPEFWHYVRQQESILKSELEGMK